MDGKMVFFFKRNICGEVHSGSLVVLACFFFSFGARQKRDEWFLSILLVLMFLFLLLRSRGS